MALIITLAWGRMGPSPSLYGQAVVVGLLFSVVGDVALMMKGTRWFAGGLGAFLLAHVCYSVGFVGAGIGWAPWQALPALGMVLWAGWLLRRLLPALRERGQGVMAAPVAVYATAISVMVWLAVCSGAPLVVTAAVLFAVSDSALAWNRFVRPLPWRDVIVMATYFTAQTLFAWSVGGA
jgi:uncharacterized membrane protein YhhN